jgi:hypothetical protein
VYPHPGVDNPKKKPDLPKDRDPAASGERRRLGRIVHDERGNASVEWQDAPADYQRPVLEIEKDARGGLSLEREGSHDPYSSPGVPKSAKNGAGTGNKNGSGTGNSSRTDLRKLSEWIKMMRELEEKKRNPSADTGPDDET